MAGRIDVAPLPEGQGKQRTFWEITHVAAVSHPGCGQAGWRRGVTETQLGVGGGQKTVCALN